MQFKSSATFNVNIKSTYAKFKNFYTLLIHKFVNSFLLPQRYVNIIETQNIYVET